MQPGKTFSKHTYTLYTILFLLLLPIIFLPFILEHKSFVWYMDGINQHYPLLQYYGGLLRGVLKGRGFAMVDFNVGLGFDTITTLQYYVLGDPFAVFSVFMKSGYGVYLYDALILLRLYLAGISFILLMRYWKRNNSGTILGALIYVFCGYTFYAGIRHPYFINPMIYLPLLLLGLEQVLRRKKPYVLVVMTFISAISNFYFFYILTIISIIYVIFRYLYTFRKEYRNSYTGFLAIGIRSGGYYLIGTAMASIFFIPVVYAFLQNGRMDSKPQLTSGLLYYNWSYYNALLQSLFASGISPKAWTILTFSSILMISLAITFSQKKYLQLSILYLLSFGALSIPAFGYFMNGFAYLANRWCFIISLLAAVTFTVTYDKLVELGMRELILAAAMIAVYGIISFLFPANGLVRYEFALLLLTLVVMSLIQWKWFRNRRYLQNIIIYILVVFTLSVHGYVYFSPQFHAYSNEFLSKSKVDEINNKGIVRVVPRIKDASFYRVETYGSEALNNSLRTHYHGVTGYYSLMNGDITNFYKQQELLNQISAYRFDSQNSRTILDAIASVKYFVTTSKRAVPFGYQLLQKVTLEGKDYYIYQNRYALPIGYTYENYMLESDYTKLTALEKQETLLNTVILKQESDYAGRIERWTESGIEQLKVKITPDSNIIMNERSIFVKKAGATIILEFNSMPNSETYVRLGNLVITRNRGVVRTIAAQGDHGALKNVNVRSRYYNSYFGKKDYLINLGYSKTGETRVTLTFPDIEKYSYETIEVFSVDMSRYTKQIMELRKSTLKNINLRNNYIAGNITMDQKGIMALSIPYSKGWSAYVDGKKANLVKANIMFMALPLSAGEHHIILQYETPYLKLGCAMTIISCIIFLVIIRLDKTDNIKEQN